MEKTCLYCKKQFNVPKCRENAKYCSNGCRLSAQKTNLNIQRKRKILICKECGKSFEVKQYRDSLFCSRECYWKYNKESGNAKLQGAKQRKRKILICKECGKSFEVHNYRTNAKYCSKDCFDKNRNEKLSCPTCGDIFYSPKHKRSKYCSLKCAAKGFDKRNSKFSQDVYEYFSNLFKKLEREGFVKFKKECFFPDLILNKKIIIECFGDYWHCNPNFYQGEYFHKKIGKTAKEIWEKDNYRIQKLSSKFKVYIIWEEEWYKEKDKSKFLNEVLTII